VDQGKRRFGRKTHRVGCEFELEGRRHTGIVCDVSARGLFVQTTVLPEREGDLEIMLRTPGHGDILVRGRAARLARRHHTAAAVHQMGFGLEITWASERYFEFVLALGAS
jgi:hypothetical protein